jgi:hypothetical protein
MNLNADAVLDAARRLPATERTALVLTLAAELLGEPAPAAGGWTRPDTLTWWAKVFACSRATLAKRIADGSVRAQRFGRRWRVAVEDLPSGRAR